MRQRPTAEELAEMYYSRHMTMEAIGGELGYCRRLIGRWMRELGVSVTKAERYYKTSRSLMGHEVSPESRLKISAVQKGRRLSPATEFKKDMVPWNKGVPMRPETKARMIAKKRGRPAWNKGMPMRDWMPEASNASRKERITRNNPRYWLGKLRPPETCEKISRTKHNQPEEVKVAIRKKWMAAVHYKPNRAERQLDRAICRSGLPYAYVGDGKVVIDGLCPDFINQNGEKKVIELFGQRFHTPEEIPTRARRFGKYGFKMLVIWEYELTTIDSVIGKIKAFTEG